jgi:hypothetical protein
MTTTPWIQVERSLRMRSEPRRELELTLFVPPHEVPQAVRGDFDKQLNKFVIEIRYLDDEEFKRTTIDDLVCLRVGKKSQRLLGIELNTAKLKVSKVQFGVNSVEHEVEHEIEKAVDKLLEERSGQKEHENYSLAMKAIQSKRRLLLDPSLLAVAH